MNTQLTPEQLAAELARVRAENAHTTNGWKMIKPLHRACDHCMADFQPTRTWQRFCCKKCAQKWFNAENARLILAAPAMAAQIEMLRAENAQLVAALFGIMHYAEMGAHACDVMPSDQPQFILARSALANATKDQS